MRVRMLKTHTMAATHPDVGAVTLEFPAGSTQHFADAEATALVQSGAAELHPEDGGRVCMRRTVVGADGSRLSKGALVHVGGAQLEQLLAADDAELAPDDTADFVAASRAAALETAIARARATAATAAKRAPTTAPASVAPATTSTTET